MKRQEWKIDDTLFSKPASLKKLVVGMSSTRYESFEPFFTIDKYEPTLAKELQRRMMKEEYFSDLVVQFCWWDDEEDDI